MKKRLIPAVIILAAILTAVVLFTLNSKPKEIVFYGNVDTRTVNLGFRFLGKIESITKDEGESVAKGEILAALENKNILNVIDDVKAKLEAESIKLSKLQNGFRKEEISQAKGEFEEASANFKLLEDIFTRQTNLYEHNATSKEAYLNARYRFEAAKGTLEKASALYQLRQKGYQDEDIKAQKAFVASLEANLKIALQDLEDSVMKSPVDGVVLARLKEEGAVVSPAERVFEISKQDEYWIKAYVDEPNLGLISQGNEASIYTDVNDKPYDGVIGYISPIAEFTPKNIETMQLRSDLVYNFRVLVKNPDKKIKQGMPVTIKLK
ncbi:MAG: HlyD family efflux transporter periplasmic adaptor subunit [Campylobacteraceae bacterium]|jgi:HlyD family secretion protein|nr:HlyD family efflux transporter periplasmic adaptor subunit [Campylobacteraceae bacterium]